MPYQPGPSDVRVYHEHELFDGGDVRATFGRVGNQPVHSHDFLELEVIGGGTGYHVTAQGRRPVRAGDVFVLRPGSWHGYEDCQELFVATTSLATSALHPEGVLLRETPALHDLLSLRPTVAGRYGIYATCIQRAAAAEVIGQVTALRQDLVEQPTNRPLLLGRLLTVLGTVLRYVGDHDVERRLHPAVSNVMARLEMAPERDWRITELAESVNLSPAHLSRLFRRHVGLPPIAYQARVRNEHAAALLARTTDPVARIGALVGWSDPAYFTRRFRAHFGVTPTEYRHRSRGH